MKCLMTTNIQSILNSWRFAVFATRWKPNVKKGIVASLTPCSGKSTDLNCLEMSYATFIIYNFPSFIFAQISPLAFL